MKDEYLAVHRNARQFRTRYTYKAHFLQRETVSYSNFTKGIRPARSQSSRENFGKDSYLRSSIGSASNATRHVWERNVYVRGCVGPSCYSFIMLASLPGLYCAGQRCKWAAGTVLPIHLPSNASSFSFSKLSRASSTNHRSRSTRGSTHGFQCTRDVRRDRLSWTWWTTVDPCYSSLLFPSFLLYQRDERGPSSRCKSWYSHFFRGATKLKGWPDPRRQQWWFLLVQSVVSKVITSVSVWMSDESRRKTWRLSTMTRVLPLRRNLFN